MEFFEGPVMQRSQSPAKPQTKLKRHSRRTAFPANAEASTE